MQNFVRSASFISLVCLLVYGGILQGQHLSTDAPHHEASGRLRKMSSLHPIATFHVGGDPDWMAVAEDAIWVTSSALNRVVQLKAKSNTIGLAVSVKEPCSGLVVAFGSLWIPSCGSRSLIRGSLKTGQILATIPITIADSEGCIAAGAGSIWLAKSPAGTVSRIDPATNTVVASITVPSGSFCPVFANGFIWITSTEHNLLSKIDPSTNRVVATIPVGKGPRFATAGAGSIWTLNQRDGTVSRVDAATGKLLANIPAGLSGHGGEIAFGFDAIWVTLNKTPITRINIRTNTVVHQWTGAGGDSIRAGLGSIWLTNLKSGTVWRISPEEF